MAKLTVPQRVHRYLSRESISIRDFVGGLKFYLDYQITDASFYQRHYAILKGKLGSITPEEERAYLAWMRVQREPHQVGGAAHKMAETRPEHKLKEMEKWIRSGVHNRRTADRVSRSLREVSKGVAESLEG